MAGLKGFVSRFRVGMRWAGNVSRFRRLALDIWAGGLELILWECPDAYMFGNHVMSCHVLCVIFGDRMHGWRSGQDRGLWDLLCH
jgi:hypothetical protein